MYARYNEKRSYEEYTGTKYDQSGRYSGTREKAEVAHSEKSNRVKDGPMN
jgi:hypothetical protein